MAIQETFCYAPLHYLDFKEKSLWCGLTRFQKKYRSKVQYCNVLQKTWVVNFAEPEQIKNVATDGHALLTHSCISFIFFFFFFYKQFDITCPHFH